MRLKFKYHASLVSFLVALSLSATMLILTFNKNLSARAEKRLIRGLKEFAIGTKTSAQSSRPEHMIAPGAAPARNVRHVLPLYSKEQFMNTLSSYLDLCRIAIDWNVTLVEPFLCGSRMYGLYGWRDPYCDNRTRMYTYRTFYDINQLTNTLSCIGECYMDTYQSFLITSSRTLIVLHAVRPWEVTAGPEENAAGSGPAIMPCTEKFPHLVEKISALLNHQTQSHSLPPFRVAGIVCWRKETTVSTEGLRQAMNRLAGTADYSILFTTYGARDPDRTSSAFREKIRSRAVVSGSCSRRLRAPAVSQRLWGLATTFLSHIDLWGKKFIAVNVRIEKIVSTMTDTQIQCCLSALNSTVSTLQQASHNRMKVLVVTDISPYGTDSCNTPHCKTHAKDFLQQLHQLGLTPLYYDAKKFSSYNSRIVAGTVEVELLTNGQYLVTAGPGLFQTRVISDFIIRSRRSDDHSKHAYVLCRDAMSFSSDITSAEVKRYVTKGKSCL